MEARRASPAHCPSGLEVEGGTRDGGRERERVKNVREKHQDGRLSREHSSISECQMTLLKGEEL